MTVNEHDRQEIAAIVDQYHHAFAIVDMDVFKAAWDKDYDNIIYIPQERAQPVRGWADLEQYFKSVEGAFERVTTMAINDLSIDVLGDVAYAFFTYHLRQRSRARINRSQLTGATRSSCTARTGRGRLSTITAPFPAHSKRHNKPLQPTVLPRSLWQARR